MTSKKELKLFSSASAIFFDFDGVIKDSVEINPISLESCLKILVLI